MMRAGGAAAPPLQTEAGPDDDQDDCDGATGAPAAGGRQHDGSQRPLSFSKSGLRWGGARICGCWQPYLRPLLLAGGG